MPFVGAWGLLGAAVAGKASPPNTQTTPAKLFYCPAVSMPLFATTVARVRVGPVDKALDSPQLGSCKAALWGTPVVAMSATQGWAWSGVLLRPCQTSCWVGVPE